MADDGSAAKDDEEVESSVWSETPSIVSERGNRERFTMEPGSVAS